MRGWIRGSGTRDVAAPVDGVVSVGQGAGAPVSRAARRGRTLGQRVGRFVARQPLGAAGALIMLALVATAVFAPHLAPHGPKDAEFPQYVPPSARFPLGTDQLGRDILSRVIWGARLSLYVGLVSVALGITFGGLVGIVTAYFGGLADMVSQRVVDVLMALPPIVLALALMAALGQSVNNVIVALVILLTPTASRTLRSVALGIKESPYVEAARAAGCTHWRIIFLHVLPNSLATYIVLVTVNIAYAIVVEAALSFLGLGAPPDEPSWGGMLTAGTQAIETAPWLIFFPGLAISLTVFGLNLLGDAIRDLTDPRLRGGLG
jgi:peptide/nickel transport system permease protein